MTRILGISGSLRVQSRSRFLMQRLLEEAGRFEADTRLLDLRRTPLPLMEPDGENPGEHYEAVYELVDWADVLVLASPDYHGSMSGPIKNFLDHFWQEFAGKLFGYVVSSHEKGLTVQDQMRTAVRQCYGWSLPYGIGFDGNEDIDLGTGAIEPGVARRLIIMARDLTVYGGLLRSQFESDRKADPPPPGFAGKFKD